MTEHSDAPTFRVRAGGATDAGQLRDHNEDSYLVAQPVFLVADGMGGHARGAAASSAVVTAFEPLAGQAWLTAEGLSAGVARAAQAVAGLAEAGGSPGSTLAGVGLAEQGGRPYWFVFNIGDSRVYLLRQGTLEQASADHSRVQELLEAGVAAEEIHVGRNVITRALGGGSGSHPTVDRWLVPAALGDRVVVCSDGLTGEVTEVLMLAALASEQHPEWAARQLVRAAVDAGGRDNVTAVVVDAVEVAATGTHSVDDDTTTAEDTEDTIEVLGQWTEAW